MSMWIVDDPETPKLLCGTNVKYGEGDGWMNEEGYIAGNLPCIFGNKGGGFQEAVELLPTTKLMSVKVSNATDYRTGDMALWELRGVPLK